MGVHELKKEDLVKLGRWESKKVLPEGQECPEYLVRSFKKKLVNRGKRLDHNSNGNTSVENESVSVNDPVGEITIKHEPLDELSDN